MGDDAVLVLLVLLAIGAVAFLVLREPKQQVIVMPNKGDPLGSLASKIFSLSL